MIYELQCPKCRGRAETDDKTWTKCFWCEATLELVHEYGYVEPANMADMSRNYDVN